MFDTILSAALEAIAVNNVAVHRPTATYRSVTDDASKVPPRWRDFAQCVIHRESRDTADAINESSGAAGLYQFMPSWQDGLPYLVRDRLVRYGMRNRDAREIRIDLSNTPIDKWDATWQRIGFAEVITRGGDSHWALAGSTCEQYR